MDPSIILPACHALIKAMLVLFIMGFVVRVVAQL